MEDLESSYINPTFTSDSPFVGDIDLQPPSPQSQGQINLYSTTQDYHNSPFSSHSDLSEQLDFSGGVFAGDEEYNPLEFDHPATNSSLLVFDDAGQFADFMPFSHPSAFDYRSPSPGSDINEQADNRSRASSTSSNSQFQQQQVQQSPSMQVAESFGSLSFHSPSWNTEPLPHTALSPPRLVMPEPPIIINAPDDDDMSGPRLHIVPATPVSGGDPTANHGPFQSSLETLRQGE